MGEFFYRAFAPELELKTRAKGGDGRTLSGIAVPYGTPVRIDQALTEQFARGAFDHQIRAAHRIKLFRDHWASGTRDGKLIGRTVLLQDDAAGLYGEWRVAATPLGDETIELIREGALSDLSIGFREGQNRRAPGGVTERVRADLTEVAVVMEGAYGELAGVTGMRSVTATPNLDQAAALLARLPVFDLK